MIKLTQTSNLRHNHFVLNYYFFNQYFYLKIGIQILIKLCYK